MSSSSYLLELRFAYSQADERTRLSENTGRNQHKNIVDTIPEYTLREIMMRVLCFWAADKVHLRFIIPFRTSAVLNMTNVVWNI